MRDFMSKAISKLMLLSMIVMIYGVSCSDESDDRDSVDGYRYEVFLVRSDLAETWIETQGVQEWWFFKSGVFRQISDGYIEPQFYGESQACTATATGTYTIEGGGRDFTYTLSYEGIDDFSVNGLCRMTNREIIIRDQPSGVINILDNKIVQSLREVEVIE